MLVVSYPFGRGKKKPRQPGASLRTQANRGSCARSHFCSAHLHTGDFSCLDTVSPPVSFLLQPLWCSPEINPVLKDVSIPEIAPRAERGREGGEEEEEARWSRKSRRVSQRHQRHERGATSERCSAHSAVSVFLENSRVGADVVWIIKCVITLNTRGCQSSL